MSSSSTSSNKKWFAILAAVVVILAAGFGVLTWYEGKLATKIKEAATSIYPEFKGEFSVSLLTNRISARDVSYIDKTLGLGFKVEAEEVSCKGLSPFEFLSGDIKHIEELSFTKYKGTMLTETLTEIFQGNYPRTGALDSFAFEIDSFTIMDVRGEFVALYEKLRQNATDAELVPLLESLNIGKYIGENMRMSIDGSVKISFISDSFMGNDSNIEKSGPTQMNNILIEVNDDKAVTIGLYGVDSVEIPGFTPYYLRLIREIVEGRADTAMMDMLLKFNAIPMETKGFVLKDMHIFDGSEEGNIHIKEINSDWKRDNAQNYDIRLSMKSLELSKTLMALIAKEQTFLKHFDKPLAMSFDLDMKISNPPNDRHSFVDVNSFDLKVDELMDLASSSKWLFTFGGPQLAEVDATYTDQGLAETILKVMADNNDQNTFQARKDLLNKISMTEPKMHDPASRELLNSLASFIENPGVFKLYLKASPPVSNDNLLHAIVAKGSSINLKSSALPK